MSPYDFAPIVQTEAIVSGENSVFFTDSRYVYGILIIGTASNNVNVRIEDKDGNRLWRLKSSNSISSGIGFKTKFYAPNGLRVFANGGGVVVTVFISQGGA
jgi:hypothetical protein